MKHSIRFRFTIIFITMMVLAVSATWCINTWFLGDYYQNYKIDILEKGYHSIDVIVQEVLEKGETVLEGVEEELKNQSNFFAADWESDSNGTGSGVERLASVVRKLRDTSNVTLLIYDSIKDQTLVSSTRDMEMLKDRVRKYIVGKSLPRQEVLRQYDNYVIQKTFDPRTKTFYLESWGFFSDNGTIFIMTTPMDSIWESAAISNRFLMYVGILVIFVGSVILFFVTKRMTAPIHRLSQLSERMSNLDFDARYVETKHSATEIDTLGNSMNAMAEKLEKAIGELREANRQLQ
ncbi:MAG: HAMP domain-containing protein, partial [Clostridium sp.]|nr:HAMP domain-containing protein [Clostridium sp.]